MVASVVIWVKTFFSDLEHYQNNLNLFFCENFNKIQNFQRISENSIIL